MTVEIPTLGTMDPALYSQMVTLRRDLHQHPEMAWQEVRTADQVEAFLAGLDISCRRCAGGTGLIADLPGLLSDRGRIALRADMDALPIHEETGLSFSSQVDGVMHACGHDGHMSILLGAASLLVQRESLPVPVRLIFQPAEETGAGALRMIEEGVLDGVAMIFGGHLDRHYPLGEIIVTDGAVNASSDEFWVEISGRGGHGARPHEAVDAVVVGSLLVIALQTIVSREVNPAHPSVVTVGKFDAGTAHNVIAGRALLRGTIRAQEQSVRERLHESIRRISKSVGQLHDADIEVEIREGTPPVLNPTEMAQVARDAAVSAVGLERVRTLETANMGGEDFGHYMRKIPGCYVRFGASVKGQEGYPAHSSKFDFDERAMGVAAVYYSELVTSAANYIQGGRT